LGKPDISSSYYHHLIIIIIIIIIINHHYMYHLCCAIRGEVDWKANFGDSSANYGDDGGDKSFSNEDCDAFDDDDEKTNILIEVYRDYDTLDAGGIHPPLNDGSKKSLSYIDTSMEDRQSLIHSVCLRVFSSCSEGMINVAGYKLKQLIQEILQDDNFNSSTIQYLMKNHFVEAPAVVRSKSEKEFFFEIEVVLKSAVVYFLFLRDGNKKFEGLLINNKHDLDAIYPYPEFSALDVDEIRYLINYTNMMKIAIKIIPPRFNKNLLMRICAFLEGSKII